MTDLEYRCIHGHDKCAEMYPGPECPYCERITDLERAREALLKLSPIQAVTALVEAARREGAEEILSSLSHPNRSALRENVRENLEQQYANIFGKRCSTDAARRLAECALETTVDFLVRALPLAPEERG